VGTTISTAIFKFSPRHAMRSQAAFF